MLEDILYLAVEYTTLPPKKDVPHRVYDVLYEYFGSIFIVINKLRKTFKTDIVQGYTEFVRNRFQNVGQIENTRSAKNLCDLYSLTEFYEAFSVINQAKKPCWEIEVVYVTNSFFDNLITSIQEKEVAFLAFLASVLVEEAEKGYTLKRGFLQNLVGLRFQVLEPKEKTSFKEAFRSLINLVCSVESEENVNKIKENYREIVNYTSEVKV